MKTYLLLFFILIIHPAMGESSEKSEKRFVSIAFHDVVDDSHDLDTDAVTTDRLVSFFEWLKGNGWNAISLDDIVRARSGEKPLPPKPILITFDDGYRSFYTRVYPLILAYRIPVVSALVGSWMEASMEETVLYNNIQVPRAKFISWDEAREMQKSGLVEFASHSDSMHLEVQGNPQGNRLPSATTRGFSLQEGYESSEVFNGRLKADLERSRKLLEKELGNSPRVLVWPFGRYTGNGQNMAKSLGFEFAMTLQPEPATITQPMQVSRYLPTHNPSLSEVVSALRFEDPLPTAQRLVGVNPALFSSLDPKVADLRLGRAIERLRVLGATTIVIDAVILDRHGKIEATWFPNQQIPMRADLLSRLAWQMRSRAGVDVVIRLPHRAAMATLHEKGRVESLFRDLAAHVPMDGLLIEGVPFPLRKDRQTSPFQNREARADLSFESLPPLSALAISLFRIVDFERPGLHLIYRVPPGTPFGERSLLADLTLFEAGETEIESKGMASNSRTIGLWLEGSTPPDEGRLISITRAFQRRGGTVLCWSPDDPFEDLPRSHSVAPTVSAATFPVKF
jgi:peptidoglycan/xylan/chitin deacetylase (PgdA/CDA1 family)